MMYKVEICVDTVESALTAQDAGADRIELCDNLSEGGTTPSFGTIMSARENLDIEMNVLIRPRGGDFLYSDLEYDIMRRDIDMCGENGINGVVLGILRAEGIIDIERTAKLVEFASPMSVTFHRAFDMCRDPLHGLDDVISTGASRLLTSGQKENAQNGIDLIKHLVKNSGKRIIIMPGSGINESNISMLARQTGAKEFHLTGRKIIESEMVFRRTWISMGKSTGVSEYSKRVADGDTLRNIIDILKAI